ncbi:hypothetical protein [uncultured Ilyobacter sp.]|uniref:hypothetical protein n=1 Tax=uncultured Ilyobacter sp. TaxID=544433 RepID=UPI0029C8033C|nr:hypothetical protein [uncultured Ilyobacter sp.]
MKLKNRNKFFLLALGTFLMLNTAISFAEEKNNQSPGSVQAGSQSKAGGTTLATSFMDAFGMTPEAAGDTGEGGPKGKAAKGVAKSGGKAGAVAVGMASVNSAAANQVTGPFTPYSYQK